jgi:hypothetical protein
MTKTKTNTTAKTHHAKSKPKRPGIHSKSKTSGLKSSKNYVKLNRGQGK